MTKPSDGHTYSCNHFPPSWKVSDITQLINLTRHTPEELVYALDQFIHAVYHSSIDKDIGACDFDALSEFVCGREKPWQNTPWAEKLKAPIRAVNIGGLFVLERWITPNLFKWGEETGIVDQHTFSLRCHELNICNVLNVHWSEWYSQDDFFHIKKLNLNTIRLPVGFWYFEEISGYPSYPYLKPIESIYAIDHPITQVISYAKKAGLQVILDLHTAPGSQNGFDNSGESTTSKEPDDWGEKWMYDAEKMAGTLSTAGAMATYINYIEEHFELDNVMLFEVLNEPWSMLDMGKVRDFYLMAIERIREIRPSMPILLHDSFRPYRWGTMMKNWPYEDVYMDNHAYHAFNIADIASDTPADDRQKQFTHEKIACGYKSQLHFQTCNAVPTIVGEFSLAIDNCIPFVDSRYADYGQCDDISSRLESPWWKRHITSFAMRQINTYERELGWAFWTYKLDSELEESHPSANFWSFRLAAKRGYILTDDFDKTDHCQHTPVADYVLGDDAPAPETIESSVDIIRDSAVTDYSNASGQHLSWYLAPVVLIVAIAVIYARTEKNGQRTRYVELSEGVNHLGQEKA